ncbi:LysR substrate-binding domain-containing protein [Hyphomicrobium sp.]|uniref:LysR substrate-binding domain-containing protein n=1 Tax=Hyphomicrobium sp. TaxID=82 RepID=UPI002E379701|nr:LysR substrate-binding domain-containing protein [Hyphomicrobium sp.]HEX2843299.1 LysR substrate-binding domain-containing protein [Hyphomicrobium sp.]
MNDTRRGLPSLSGLQAFEAVARRLSFAQAAEELSLTPTAISHRIRTLEAELGTVLFRRNNRFVALTEDGERIAAGVRRAFDQLRATMVKTRDDGATTLCIAAEPAFITFWLIPHLPTFRQRFPEITVNVSPAATDAPFDPSRSDLTIAFGAAFDPNLKYECLSESVLVPVSSARYPLCNDLAAGGESWRTATLLHMNDSRLGPPFPEWRDWLDAAGLSRADPDAGPQFGECGLLLEACRRGQGVALGLSVLVGSAIEAGELVALSDVTLPVSHSYALVYPAEHASRPAVRAFRSWIMGEMRARSGRATATA